MRAKRVYEDVDFQRGKDPKRAMDIGLTPKRKLDALKEELNKFGITMTWHPDRNQGEGFYYMIFDDDKFGSPGELTSLNLQAGYITDEAAMAEYDMSGGFWLAYGDGSRIIDIDEVNHDSNNFIKVLLKEKYDESNLDREIKVLKSQLEELEKVKSFLDNES